MNTSNKIEGSKNLSMHSKAVQLSASWRLKIFGLLAICLACFLSQTEGKRSACARYGHVCWGGHGKRNGNQLQNLRSTSNDEGGDDFVQFPQEEYRGFNQVVPKQQIPFLKIPHVQKQSSYYVGNLRGENPTLQKLFRLSSLRPRPLGMNARNIKLSLEQQLVDDGDVDSGGSTDDRGILNDSLIVPEMMPSSLKVTSQEIVTNPRMQLPSAFKRNEDDGIGNSPGGGTEEPLETSANGLDTGAVATFFRDRKASERQTASGNSGTDRYSKTIDSKNPYEYPGHVQLSEAYKIRPLTRSRPIGIHYFNTRMFT